MHPDSDIDDVTAAGTTGCGVAWTNGTGGGDVAGDMGDAGACATDVVFSPDGRHLAWLLPPEGIPWTVQTVDWNAEGPGDDDAGFGLDFADRNPGQINLEDWVWTTDDGVTARGYLTFTATEPPRRERSRYTVAIERQADGALAILGPAQPVADAGGWQTIAADGAYLLQVRGDEARLSNGAAQVALPARFPRLDPIDYFRTWVSALGSTVVFGDGWESAWRVEFDGTQFTQPVRIAATVVSADLFGGWPEPVVDPQPIPEEGPPYEYPDPELTPEVWPDGPRVDDEFTQLPAVPAIPEPEEPQGQPSQQPHAPRGRLYVEGGD